MKMEEKRITKNIVEKVAENARLKLTSNEIETITPQLEQVLEFFAKIEEAEINKKQIIHPIPVKNNMRTDVVKDSLTQEEALRNVITKKDGFVKGPKVV